jgi:cobalt-zinc-cadmium resistance protein CzcA
VEQLAQQEQVSIAKLKLEKSKLSPDLTAAYNNTSMKGFGADDIYYPSSKRFQSVQVGVGIPLFGGAQRNLIKASDINIQAAKNSYAAGLQNLQYQYQQALLQYNKSIATINYYEKSALPNADTIIAIANDQFLNGDINYLDWVLLINQAITIQNEYIDAIKELNKSIIEINSYINQ